VNGPIEIRVHGVSGTPPNVMLGGPAERDTDFEEDVWKRSDRQDGVRAVRWSNLTSGSPVSALWFTLIPYMLLNLAGWALPPSGAWRHRTAVVAVRAAGLALTMIFSTVAAVGFIGVGGYQVLRPSVGTAWSLVLGVGAALVVILVLWLATSALGERAQADRLYLRSLHVAVALWSVWWTLLAAADEAYGRVDAIATGGVGVGWPIPILAGGAIVVVGLIEGLERFARPAGALLAVAAGTLLVIDVVGVFGAGEAGVQPEQLLTIDDPLTTIVQWFAVLALGAMVMGISRSHREAAPVIGTLIALAGSTGASVGAAGIWVSARLSGAVPPSGIAPIAQAFLTGTLIVFAVLAIVLARSAGKDEPILRGVYLSVVRARNGLFPVLVAVPSVTGAVLAMTVAGLRLDGSAPTEFVWIAAIAATVGGIATAVALGRLGLSAPAALAGLAVVVGWLAPLTGFFTFTGVAVTVTMALPLALVLTRVAGAVGDREKRRTLAVPWDVGSYFARRFHPFAPPTYHDRAVADLDAVIDRFRDRGVVVGAHSQGTVVVTSALSRAEDTGGVGLLTYGSPLASLYARFFPRYFTDEYFEAIAGRVAGGWINLWRPTDPISGPLSPGPDDRQVDDVRVRGHAAYWRDDEPEFARARDDLTARIPR
jgi:hypothetical protein